MQSLTQQFEAFCRSKPEGERYEYVSVDNCPIAQFLRSQGFRGLIVGPDRYFGFRWFVVPWFGRVPERIDLAVLRGRHTFGALADRLEAAR